MGMVRWRSPTVHTLSAGRLDGGPHPGPISSSDDQLRTELDLHAMAPNRGHYFGHYFGHHLGPEREKQARTCTKFSLYAVSIRRGFISMRFPFVWGFRLYEGFICAEVSSMSFYSWGFIHGVSSRVFIHRFSPWHEYCSSVWVFIHEGVLSSINVAHLYEFSYMRVFSYLFSTMYGPIFVRFSREWGFILGWYTLMFLTKTWKNRALWEVDEGGLHKYELNSSSRPSRGIIST
jgi:hypothetical protein